MSLMVSLASAPLSKQTMVAVLKCQLLRFPVSPNALDLWAVPVMTGVLRSRGWSRSTFVTPVGWPAGLSSVDRALSHVHAPCQAIQAVSHPRDAQISCRPDAQHLCCHVKDLDRNAAADYARGGKGLLDHLKGDDLRECYLYQRSRRGRDLVQSLPEMRTVGDCRSNLSQRRAVHPVKLAGRFSHRDHVEGSPAVLGTSWEATFLSAAVSGRDGQGSRAL